ncbi:hypothetical protein [Actinoplanes sp. URMC 104]|uniref:hypothetical protein n=1 Tax=Actinoplanes sp. URMC 104 TaxID=3423409 RepID=UPI003F1AC7F8
MLTAVIRMRLVVVALALVAVAGCASVGNREDAAAGVAARLLSAVDAGDGDAACAVLAPGTAQAVAEDEPCPEAILDKDLPGPGRVLEASVYGQWAQVRLDDDTVFLGAFPGGWRVVAAGCTPRGSRPYDCTVQGD